MSVKSVRLMGVGGKDLR